MSVQPEIIYPPEIRGSITSLLVGSGEGGKGKGGVGDAIQATRRSSPKS